MATERIEKGASGGAQDKAAATGAAVRRDVDPLQRIAFLREHIAAHSGMSMGHVASLVETVLGTRPSQDAPQTRRGPAPK